MINCISNSSQHVTRQLFNETVIIRVIIENRVRLFESMTENEYTNVIYDIM